MRKLSFLLIIMLLFIMQACYKDVGNYDYKTLSEVAIDTTGGNIATNYALYRYDTLTIEPTIYLDGTLIATEAQVSDKLSFNWSIYQAVTGSTIYTRDTLASTIKLQVPIIKPAGRWVVLLSVKDLKTKVETYQRFNLEVSEVLSDGWMVLYEREGKTDVGLIVDDRSKTGITRPRLFLDLIRGGNGESLTGKPVAMVHSAAALSSGHIVVASEQDMGAFERSSFEKSFSFNDLFWSAPTTSNMGAFATNASRKELAIVNNRVHITNFSTSGSFRTNKFGVARIGEYGELQPWAATFYGTSYDAVVYDKTNKKFMYVPTNGNAVIDFPAQVASTEFNVANVGMDMLATDWGLTNYEYSIMKNETGTFMLASNFMGLTTTVGLRKVNMSSSPGIAGVSTMTAASTGQFILYGSGNAVYNFRYNAGVPAEQAWSAPQGEQVTCVRLQKFYFPSIQAALLPLANQVVYIATWNETSHKGKVYSYRINPSNGAIDVATERVTEGYGKVMNMSYKWNL